MKKIAVPIFVLSAIFSVAAAADQGSIQTLPGPGLYKDEGVYVPAFPGGDPRVLMSRPIISGDYGPSSITTTTRQRALVPESGALQSYPAEQGVIHLEPRGGYNMEVWQEPRR